MSSLPRLGAKKKGGGAASAIRIIPLFGWVVAPGAGAVVGERTTESGAPRAVQQKRTTPLADGGLELAGGEFSEGRCEKLQAWLACRLLNLGSLEEREKEGESRLSSSEIPNTGRGGFEVLARAGAQEYAVLLYKRDWAGRRTLHVAGRRCRSTSRPVRRDVISDDPLP